MKKRMFLSTVVVGTLLTAGVALAGPGFGNCDGSGKGPGAMSYEQHEDRMEHRLEMMSTVLDLTEAQQEQLKSLFDQQWQDHQQLREQMHSARDAMHEARSAESFNEADFRAKAEKQAELKTEMMVAGAKMKEKLYAILTPEQQQKADTLRGLMGERGKGHHGGRGFGF